MCLGPDTKVSILVAYMEEFWEETEHFNGKNGALRWALIFAMNHHETEVPDPLAVEDLISYKLNNR